MVTPANPPAIITADNDKEEGSCPSGVSFFLMASYARK